MHHREIDGLRGLSVLLVVLFHLQLPAFMGGFVGIEVFFVISGFLITRIVLADMDADRFSLRGFYARRVARLLPALAVTTGVSVGMAALLFPPQELVHAARQALYALFSISNILFWEQTDYWAPNAKRMILLHTWSLGVEVQFYLVFPLLLWCARRLFAAAGAWLILIAIVAGGVWANQWFLATDRAAAYFLTPLRLYEFAIGGLGGLMHMRNARASPDLARVAPVATVVGLALILHSAVYFHPLLRFPGFHALVPASGALLVLLAGATPPATLLLANRVMVWMGERSYSLYLVHWPLIVLYREYHGPRFSAFDCALLFLGAITLAVLLHRYVEVPFRLRRDGRSSQAGWRTSRVLVTSAAAVVVIAAFSIAAMQGQGWPSRLPQHLREVAALDQPHFTRVEQQFMEAHCRPRGEVLCGERIEDGPNILLLGDSRALDIYLALRHAYPDAGILASHVPGCPPVFDAAIGVSPFEPRCPQLNEERLRAALLAPPGTVVFLAMEFNNWRAAAVLETARRLASGGKRVFVLGESRFLQGKPPQAIVLDQERFALDRSYAERFLVSRPFGLDDSLAPRFAEAGTSYVSTRRFFRADGYRLFTRDGKQLLSFDGIHLTPAGAEEFGDYLASDYPFFR